MKKLTILAISLFAIGLSGCAKTIITDDEIKAEIGEEVFWKHMKQNYKESCLESNNPDIPYFCPLERDYSLDITSSCLENLVIRNRDINTKRIGIVSKEYVLSEIEQINKTPFLECTKNKLDKISLNAKQIELLVNSDKYKKTKNGNNQLFNKKLEEVREKGYMTALDGYEIMGIIRTYNEIFNMEEDQIKQKELIKNL